MSLLTRIFGANKNDHYTQGIVLYNKGDYEAAIAEFEHAVRETHNDGNPYHSLGRFYAAEAYTHLGLIHLRTQDYERAEAEFRRAVEENPAYPDRHYYLGVLREKRGDHAGAAEAFRDALELHPDYKEARAYLAVTFFESGDERAARSEMLAAMQRGFAGPAHLVVEDRPLTRADVDSVRAQLTSSSMCSAHVESAADLYTHGHLPDAIAELEKAVTLQPTYADLHCRLGVLLVESGRIDDGVDRFDRALAINPQYADAHLYRGRALLLASRPADAVPSLQAAAEAYPETVSVLALLATAYGRSGDSARAADVAHAALAIDPACQQAQRALALADLLAGRTHDAYAHTDPAELWERSALALAAGRPADALRDMQKGSVRREGTVDEDLLLGLAKDAAGHAEDARGHFESALEKDPGWWPARLALAHNYERSGRFGDALRAIGRQLEAETDNPDVLVLVANCYRQMDRVSDAITTYNRALAYQAGHVNALIGRALAQRVRGRSDAAMADLHEVLRRDPLNLLARRLVDITSDLPNEDVRRRGPRQPTQKAA